MLKAIFTWWNGATLGQRFHIGRRGVFVGQDDYGNRLGHIQRQLIIGYSHQERKGKLQSGTKPGRKKSLGLTGGGFELTIES